MRRHSFVGTHATLEPASCTATGVWDFTIRGVSDYGFVENCISIYAMQVWGL